MQEELPINVSTAFEPYLYQTLSQAIGCNIVIQTTKNPIQGCLKTVLPDHIVIEVHCTPFYIRIQEIIWFSQA